MTNFTKEQNKEINNLLDKAFELHGLEYNDFNFTNDLTADEYIIIIEDRIKEIEEMSKEEDLFVQAIKALENGEQLCIIQKKLFVDNKLIWTTGGIDTGFNYTIHTNLSNYKKESHYYLMKAYKCGWKSIFINNIKAAIAIINK